ncbi:Uma2 family endonuclease [Silvibacterium bohemicum]|uniref:Uma2 family endonuclease n=1 Tax=Silvibacterium bohemicum TaxID=1577686 RepID=A0A841JWN9_9BACT|nr:Uma2 family endonuclease [Silvibacterium bohemicum]MBB6145823.1 Uma2 family endonuclease [Silvibacterium bohemicum]
MSATPVLQRETDQSSSESSSFELSLRDIPLPIILRPAQPLSDEDLLAFCAANRGMEIESDADGSITIMTPAGPDSSRLNQYLAAELTLWSRQAGGIVFGPDLGIRFPDKTMRGPDVAWLSAPRWNALSPGQRKVFLSFCPEFILELRSESDRASTVEAKMEFWLSRGAELGWLIDPRRKLAMIYRPGQEPATLLQPEILEGEGPITGFRLEMHHFWEYGISSTLRNIGVPA